MPLPWIPAARTTTRAANNLIVIDTRPGPWSHRVDIESWPYRIRHQLRDWDPYWDWLDANVGVKGQDRTGIMAGAAGCSNAKQTTWPTR